MRFVSLVSLLGVTLSVSACCSETAPCSDTRWETTWSTSSTESSTGPTSTTDPERPLPPEGAYAGALQGMQERRAAYDLREPVQPDNPNDQLFAPGTVDERESPEALLHERVDPVNWKVSDRASTGRVAWNGAEGRRLADGFVQSDYTSNWPLPGREVCVEPEIRIDCCTYTLTEGEQSSGTTVTYYSPEDLFFDESSAQTALGEIYAQVPLYLPFTDPDVKLSQGWIYNSGGAHGSHDYNQSAALEEGDDPAFKVRSIASGTVVAKYWDDWHGNVVIIEHADIGDIEYRSHYFHLRDGLDHDVAMALSETDATGDPSNNRDKYVAFAKMEPPNELWWGTNDQAMPIDVGDHVGPHEFVAWSGNTGPGGAGNGLDEKGNPSNAKTANNHLHFMISVRHPEWTGGEWLYVDPAGVYEEVDSGCYDLLDNTEYDRLLAPFYPYFHGVELGVFNEYLYYYGQMGRSPTTFTVQQPGDGAIAAGAFKPGATSWYVYDYLKADDFQQRWDDLVEADFRLTERSVTLDTQSVPRHNGVFRPDGIDDWWSFAGQSLADYQDTFDDLTGEGYGLADFFAYHDGDTDLIASIFVPATGGFQHHGLLDSAEFTTLTNDLAAEGWLPVDVNVMELSGSTTLSALYRQTGDARMVHWGMVPTEYQQWMNFYLSEGWDLEVVQNYAAGERYAAIWSKD